MTKLNKSEHPIQIGPVFENPPRGRGGLWEDTLAGIELAIGNPGKWVRVEGQYSQSYIYNAIRSKRFDNEIGYLPGNIKTRWSDTDTSGNKAAESKGFVWVCYRHSSATKDTNHEGDQQ